VSPRICALCARHSVTKSVNICKCDQDGNNARLRSTYFDGVERSAGAFGVELDPPYFLARLSGGPDPFDGGVVAVDEEWLPSSWEGVLQSQRVLVILACTTIERALTLSRKENDSPRNVDPASLDRPSRSQREHGLIVPTIPKRHAIRVEPSCEADNLMAHADPKHGLVPFLQRLAELQRSLHTV
jgi:hypothetical protein